MTIKNDHQLAQAKALLTNMHAAAEGTDDELDRLGLNARAEELFRAISVYEVLKAGDPAVLSFEGDEMCEALVQARISRGLTQAELAEEMGVSQQQVQKDENGGYQRASLGRILDVLDALDFKIAGRLIPREHHEESASSGGSRVQPTESHALPVFVFAGTSPEVRVVGPVIAALEVRWAR